MDWLLICLVILIGSLVGYFVGRSATRSSTHARIHKTLLIDRTLDAQNAELDAEMSASSVDKSTSSSRSGSTGTTNSDEEIQAADADVNEDLETTLSHMKAEHAQHIQQFQESAAAASTNDSTTHSPSPIPASHRNIIIVAKGLPLQITNITNQDTPLPTPAASPLAAPLDSSAANSDVGGMSDLSLGESATSAAATNSLLTVKGLNQFDLKKRPSLSQLSPYPTPSSKVVIHESEHGQTKFKVEWDDSRSFLSNLRCLITQTNKDLPAGLTEMDPTKVTWIGLSNVTEKCAFATDSERLAYEQTLRDNHCAPVYLDADTFEGFSAFCKVILWPLLHYLTPIAASLTHVNLGERWEEYWKAYCHANQVYADEICATIKHESDIVWIHNMHLFMLPQMIRDKKPRATIGLFVHTPFPSSDVFRSLPSRKEVLESIMCADLIAFQTFDYARHFLSCIKRVMDLDFETLPGGALGVRHDGRFVSILISHVGIQSSVFREAAESGTVKRQVARLRAHFPNKKIIIGVDDVDRAKAPLLKLQAFDRFLTRYPDWLSKIVILQIYLPSRNSAQVGEMQNDLDEYVKQLKQKYGDGIIQIISPFRSSPIGSTDSNANASGSSATSLINPKSLLDLVALYQASDVCATVGCFDGLNLVPYEYTASQTDSNPGALVISEFMGCSRSLNGVLRVNPWSLDSVSTALHTALQMTADERRANHSRRYNYVLHHSIESWANGFLEQLIKATQLGAELKYVHAGPSKLMGLKANFTHLPTRLLTEKYAAATERVIFLDYDGTLVPADKTASACPMGPPATVVKLLKFLSEDPRTVVFLMSGRTRATLTEWFGHIDNLGLASEKGLWLRWPARIASQCRFDLSGETDVSNASSASADESDEDDEDDSESSDEEQDGGVNGSSSTFASSASLSSVPTVNVSEWECLTPLADLSWKATSMEIIRSYMELTDGSWIEDKEAAIVFHYEQADVEYGRMQAAELQKLLVKVLANPNVDVLRYDKTRILEVKPHGVGKGLACTAILESLWIRHEKLLSEEHKQQAAAALASASSSASTPPSLSVPTGSPVESLSPRTQATSFHPFVLAIGDDRSDEEMFNAIAQKLWLDGRVRGRESSALLELYSRSAFASSAVPTSMPPTPAHALHDHELSPTPVSPVTVNGQGYRFIRSPPTPSADPFLFSVCVGMKPSNASYFLNSPDEVLRTLYGLVLQDQAELEAKVQPTGRSGLTKRSNAKHSGGSTGGMTKNASFTALSSMILGDKQE